MTHGYKYLIPIRFLRGSFLIAAISAQCFFMSGCEIVLNRLYDYPSISNCYRENPFDYSTARMKIVGTWEWKFVKCCPLSLKPYESRKESQGLRISFYENGIGIVEDSEKKTVFAWDLVLVDNTLFGFSNTLLIEQLYGRLLFCNDLMVCNDSYLDGKDNFFTKL